jgi:hypothetical protein
LTATGRPLGLSRIHSFLELESASTEELDVALCLNRARVDAFMFAAGKLFGDAPGTEQHISTFSCRHQEKARLATSLNKKQLAKE